MQVHLKRLLNVLRLMICQAYVDGMNVLDVYKATQEAVDRAKKGRTYINRM